MILSKPSGGISRLRHVKMRRRSSGVGKLRRRQLRYADSAIHLQMFFGAVRTIALAGFLIALAGEFVAAMNAIAISRRGSSLDRHQSHSASLQLRMLPAEESWRKTNAHLQHLDTSEEDRKSTRVRVASGGRDPRFSRAARSTGCPAEPGTLRQHADRTAGPKSGEFRRGQRKSAALFDTAGRKS
jgi:hypothetical protein